MAVATIAFKKEPLATLAGSLKPPFRGMINNYLRASLVGFFWQDLRALSKKVLPTSLSHQKRVH